MVVSKAFRFFILLLATGCYAQQSSAGIENPWDVRAILTSISKGTAELKPLLDSLTPQQWSDQKGAPTTYILQWQTAERQVNDLTVTTKLLAVKTESLSLALDEYFRLEALDVTTRSLEEGTRRYATRQAADKLSQIIARNFTNREKFRDYIRDLASSTEQNFKIADEEAQRCRGMISKEPGPARTKLRK